MVRVSLLLLGALLGLACSEPAELQTVRYKKLASFEVPQVWQLHGELDGEVGYVHEQLPGVELWVSGRVQDMGAAMTVEHLRAIIGKQVNLDHGGAVSRLSMGGNAVVRYPIKAEQSGQPHAVRWVVAKPYGAGMMRLDVSIEYMDDQIATSDIDNLVQAFDPGVSDATFGS